jgi:hypothetical protein
MMLLPLWGGRQRGWLSNRALVLEMSFFFSLFHTYSQDLDIADTSIWWEGEERLFMWT